MGNESTLQGGTRSSQHLGYKLKNNKLIKKENLRNEVTLKGSIALQTWSLFNSHLKITTLVDLKEKD